MLTLPVVRSAVEPLLFIVNEAPPLASKLPITTLPFVEIPPVVPSIVNPLALEKALLTYPPLVVTKPSAVNVPFA